MKARVRKGLSRKDGRQRLEPLDPGEAAPRRAQPAEDDGQSDDQAAIDEGGERTRQEPCQKQRPDILLDDDRVDHQDCGRRYEGRERAGGCNHADGEALVVSDGEHLRNCDAAEHRRRGHRGHGHRRKAGGREYGRDREPARQPSDPPFGSLEHGPGQPGVVREEADEDERRDERQRLCRNLGVGHLARRLCRHRQRPEKLLRVVSAFGPDPHEARQAGNGGGERDAKALRSVPSSRTDDVPATADLPGGRVPSAHCTTPGQRMTLEG